MEPKRLYFKDEEKAGRIEKVNYHIPDAHQGSYTGHADQQASMATEDERYDPTVRIAWGKRETGFKGGF